MEHQGYQGYQGFTEPRRRTGMVVLAIVGSTIAFVAQIYPFVDLISLLCVYYYYGLSAYGWAAFIGSGVQLIDCICASVWARVRHSTYLGLKGVIIGGLVLHIVAGLCFFIPSIMFEDALWSFLGFSSLGLGTAAYIALLFLDPRDADNPSGAPMGVPTNQTAYSPSGPYAAAPTYPYPPQYTAAGPYGPAPGYAPGPAYAPAPGYAYAPGPQYAPPAK